MYIRSLTLPTLNNSHRLQNQLSRIYLEAPELQILSAPAPLEPRSGSSPAPLVSSMATSSLTMFGSSFVACASLSFVFKGLNDKRKDSAEKKLERLNFKDTVEGFIGVLLVHVEVQKLRGLHQAEMWKKLKNESTPE
ncbi:hypothetical protein M0R45_034326 [Rubus argutus]|uniref:Uncharacterized protein n=1 Tax=Rubus argutus TaxID=59490 RepID=A0AAW1VV86_RUBAR